MRDPGSRAICLAVTGTGPYLSYALKCIESVRRFNSDLIIYLFIFGKPQIMPHLDLKALKIIIRRRPKIKSYYPTMVKWLALRELKEERVLFLDSDTFSSGNVKKLFERYRLFDFYARREIGSVLPKCRISGIDRQVSISKLNLMFMQQGTPRVPIFNSGIMLFNNYAHRKMSVPICDVHYWNLMKGVLLYPSENHHLRDEIAASLALSQEALTWSYLSSKAAPYLLELDSGAVNDPGIVTHAFNENFCKLFAI